MLNKHKILSNLPADRLELSLFKSIDSTNEECKRINLVKDIHVIIAEEQTMGKADSEKNGLVQALATYICRFHQKK